MSTSTPAERHADHLFQVGVMHARANDKRLPQAVREEAWAEVLRYRDAGLILLKYGKEKPMAKKSRAHETKRRTFSGQGIIFAVIDDHEKLIGAGAQHTGRVSTTEVIANAIEDALDHGHEDSEAIARYITTSAFQHEPDKRVRFNSVLKAGDAVGAMMMSKLHNAYNEMVVLAEEEEDPVKKKAALAEASGFAAALTIVMSPFSCEYEGDPRLVDWDVLDRLVPAYEKEQRQVRRERKGNPQ